MALDQIYEFHSMVFRGPDFGTETQLGGITTTAASRNPQVVQEYTDGNVFPTLTTIRSFQDDFTFSTTNIDTAIDLLGAQSSCLKVGNAVDLYYGLIDPCAGGFAIGDVHRRLTIESPLSNAGIIQASSINTSHREDSTLEFMIKPQFDGVNAPFSITPNVALPTGTADNGNRYTLGPATVGGVVINAKKSLNVSFNASEQRESADSSIHDELISINQYASQVQISGIDPRWFDAANLGIDGKKVEHADTRYVLQRRLQGAAGFHAPGDAVHVVITQSGVAVPTNVASSSVNSPVQTAFTVYSKFDGTNVPIILTTGQTYTQTP